MNFIQQTYRGKNKWYLYVLTLLVVFVGWQIIGMFPLLIGAVLHSADTAEFLKAAQDNFMSMGMNKNLFLFLMILSFVGGLLALFICVEYIHKREFKTIITSRRNIDWKRFWFGFILWGAIAGTVTFLGVYFSPETSTWNFKPIPFFTLLAVSLLFLPLQTSFEELLFRGYLMQGFGAWFRNKLVPLVLTSVIFGLLHGMNPEVEKLGYISMVFYIGTGLLFGIVTLMDEGTELALGLHAVNNIIAAVLVTTDWTAFQTDALYIDSSDPSVGFEMFFPVLVLYPILLFIFSKKYGWKNWEDKLTGTVKKPSEDNYRVIEGIGDE